MERETADTELIQLVLGGNQNAYARLMEKYQHFVFTMAFRLTDSREDAEEIAQDVFIKAYRSLSDFKGGSKFSTWLYTIAHNTGISFLRKKKIHVKSIDEDRQTGLLDQHESGFRANLVEEKSRNAAVNQAITLLAPEDAQIITLFYKADQSLAEIGHVMGMEPNTVKVRLFRARQRLREKMETYYAEEVAQLREA